MDYRYQKAKGNHSSKHWTSLSFPIKIIILQWLNFIFQKICSLVLSHKEIKVLFGCFFSRRKQGEREKSLIKGILIIMWELCKPVKAPLGAPTGLFHLFQTPRILSLLCKIHRNLSTAPFWFDNDVLSEPPDNLKWQMALGVGRRERIQARATEMIQGLGSCHESKGWENWACSLLRKEEKPHHHIPAFKEGCKEKETSFWHGKSEGWLKQVTFRKITIGKKRKTFLNENTELE